MKLPIGYSDFKKIIDNKFDFVDKSLLIKEIIDDTKVISITRPRRFGKTLNLSMLYYFFNLPELITGNDDPKHLFKELKINNETDYLIHQNQYPVIFITFKDIKDTNEAAALNKIFELVVKIFGQHEYLTTSDRLSQNQKDLIKAVISRQANQQQIENALLSLSECLYAHHQKPLIILIDEYDTPIQSGYLNGFAPGIITFMRNFLGAGLKDNVCLKKAVLTGILRVSKENLFSGLNNLKVYTVLDKGYADYFGFLEPEVNALLQAADFKIPLPEIKDWYNGYQFGDKTIYNPWSIISCLESGLLKPYWINTSDNALIKNLLRQSSEKVKEQFELLIANKSIEQIIDDNIMLMDLDKHADAVWGLLLFSGYLKALQVHYNEIGQTICQVSIPNKEILGLYLRIFQELHSQQSLLW